ncbi:hypothetical protein F5Y02DRAFT_370709, partial [Annulohypoxylon stygium]
MTREYVTRRIMHIKVPSLEMKSKFPMLIALFSASNQCFELILLVHQTKMETHTIYSQPKQPFPWADSKGHTTRAAQDKIDNEDESNKKDKDDVKKSSSPMQTDMPARAIKTDGDNDGENNDIDQTGEGNRGKNRGNGNRIRQKIPAPPPGLGYMKWIGLYAVVLGIVAIWARWLL